MDSKEIIIVTGLSGAGKTSALKCLEDINYYTIDNMPLGLEKYLLETELSKIAIGVDIRTFKKIKDFLDWLEVLKSSKVKYKIIYLEAEESVILGRYTLSRRAHPLKEKTLLESIRKEKEIIFPIKQISDLVIDTTEMRVVNLEKIIKENICEVEENSVLNIHIQSFGFKYGIPMDSDLMFDVRFVKNPYYVAELKEKNGYDKEIIDFVLESEEAIKFYEKLLDLLEYLIPQYIKEGKKHLTISIGCSGGKHRSVVFTNKLAQDLGKNKKMNIYVSHREKEIGHW